jgi:serpin B
MTRDLATFESTMTAATLDDIVGRIADGGIHLSIPKWTARTHLQLNDMLSTLGMPSAFSGAADFSAMVDGGLRVSTVEHEAFIEVDEAGTRAAAATGGAMVESYGPTIAISRPFLYPIRDTGAGTTLFIGHVTNPSTE